ncbi:MAG: rhodanese-like domain-containing protein [Planctomycetes bacterium]|nr:rhodanese-like domain-containing protein [Planctomycetota bacterium]
MAVVEVAAVLGLGNRNKRLKSDFMQSSCRARPLRFGSLVLETAAVLALGATIALAFNFMKDKDNRFKVFHNYLNLPAPTDSDENERFQFIDHDQTIEAFQSEAFENGTYIFIDARNDEAYAEKHIPGAYQLDHYYADRYIESLLPICRDADQIIVYCNGGKCDDSKLATLDLIDNGVAEHKLFVYKGGVVAWNEDGLPFERGERGSGDIVYDDPE